MDRHVLWNQLHLTDSAGSLSNAYIVAFKTVMTGLNVAGRLLVCAHLQPTYERMAIAMRSIDAVKDTTLHRRCITSEER